MADPISITGLVLQIGYIVKQLYDYGKAASHAQKDIISLCSELSALKSVLADIESKYNDVSPQIVTERLETTQDLVNGLSKELTLGTKSSKRVLQSLKWPLSESQVTRSLAEIERLKSWFLMRLMTDTYSQTKDVQAGLSALTKTVQDDISERKLASQTETASIIRKILAPVSLEATHRKCCETWSDTPSGSWLLNGQFKDWLESDDNSKQLLTLTGRSGSGKTTLISQAIEKAREISSSSVAKKLGYFYCSYNTAASQEPRNVLGSWLAQITDDSDLNDRYGHCLSSSAEIKSDEIENSISDVGGTVLLFLDAINESHESQSLLECMKRLTLSSRSTRIKCFVTTTPLFDFQFDHISVNMLAVCIDCDIEKYVRSKISRHRILQSIPEERIISTLVSKANGMFRWVDCQVTMLASQRTPKLIVKTLENLPGNLNDTYVRILGSIPALDQAMVREALLWLCFALRPLTLDELCEAAVYETRDDAIDDSCRLQPPHQLVQMCNGLVVLDDRSNTVTLAHSSVRDFLTGKDIGITLASFFALAQPMSQRRILHKSLSYLSIDEFHFWHDEEQPTAWWSHKYPLLSYVCNRWCDHAKSYQDQFVEADFEVIDSFLLTHKRYREKSLFTFWITCITTEDLDNDLGDYWLNSVLHDAGNAAEPLYYMASAGFETYVERMFAKGMISKNKDDGAWYIDHKCGRGFSTALQVACYRSSLRMVRTLLQEGADPNSTSEVSGLSCMGAAHDFDRPDSIEELMKYGGKFNTDDSDVFELDIDDMGYAA